MARATTAGFSIRPQDWRSKRMIHSTEAAHCGSGEPRSMQTAASGGIRRRPRASKRAQQFHLSTPTGQAGAGDRKFRNSVAKIVARHYCVNSSEIFSNSRRQKTMRARHALVVILMAAGLPPAIVGQLIKRDRSTALSSMRRADGLWFHDADWRTNFLDVCRDIASEELETTFGIALNFPWPVEPSELQPHQDEINADAV